MTAISLCGYCSVATGANLLYRFHHTGERIKIIALLLITALLALVSDIAYAPFSDYMVFAYGVITGTVISILLDLFKGGYPV